MAAVDDDEFAHDIAAIEKLSAEDARKGRDQCRAQLQDAYRNLQIAKTIDQERTERERIRRLEKYLNAYERRLREAEYREYFVDVYTGPVPPPKPLGIYRFQSHEPAPPRKRPFLPLPTSRNNPRPSEEELARDPAKALRQTSGLSPAENLTPTPGNVPIDKDVLLGELFDQMVEEGRAVVGMLRAAKKPEEVRQKHPRFFAEVLDLLPENQRHEFYSKARQGVPVPQLLSLIGQVRAVGGEMAKKLRTEYRRLAGHK